MKKNKKSLLVVMGLMLTLVVAVAGGTMALFTDNTVNANNHFQAGTVIIANDRNMGDTLPGPMFYSAASDPTGLYPYDTTLNPYRPPGGEALGGWAPGDKASRAMNVHNKGTLYVKLTQLKADVNPAGITSGPAYDEFIEKMHIKVLYPSTNIVLYDGSLEGLLNGYLNIPPILVAPYPSGPVNITFEAALDISGSNQLQGETFVFDFTFHAEQLRNNP